MEIQTSHSRNSTNLIALNINGFAKYVNVQNISISVVELQFEFSEKNK